MSYKNILDTVRVSYDINSKFLPKLLELVPKGMKARLPTEAVTDPIGASSSKFRVGRGGVWSVGDNYSKSAFRDGGTPDFNIPRLGFRLAMDIPR